VNADMGCSFQTCSRKSKGVGPTQRHRNTFRDNTRMNITEITPSCVDWFQMAQDKELWAGCCELGNNTMGPKDTWIILTN
jgi:hypothetical protein